MAYRTKIPTVGANASVASHNLQDFRPYTPTGGNIYFVDSGVDGTTGLSPDDAFGTLDEVFSSATASQGDIAYVMPGHAETISAATGCVFDVAGVQVVGLGWGALRPQITLDTAAGATVSITAANCRLANVEVISDFTNGVTAGITLGASADGCLLEDIGMTEGSATKEFLTAITIAAACHNVTIKRLRYKGVSGGSATNCILLSGASNNFTLLDSYIRGDFSGAAVDGTAAASTDVLIRGNVVGNLDTGAGLGIAFHNSSTGFVSDNRVTNLKDTVAGYSGTGLYYHENYGSNAAGAQGTIAIGLAADT